MRVTLLATMAGMIAMADFVIAAYFTKFWRRTRDRLFALFALAFAILGAQRLVLGALLVWGEHNPALYSLRLLAFVLIIAAIVDKNRARR